MTEEEILTRIHNIEHKLDIILTKLRLSDISMDLQDEGKHKEAKDTALLAKAPPTLPQDARPPCPVCSQPIQMQAIQMTPSLMYNKDGTSFFGYKRICGCKITSVRL